MSIFVKDPDAVIDFTINWNDGYLETDSPAETITASDWSVDPSDSPGLSIDSDSNTTTTATAFLSGGLAGKTYMVTNRVTTSSDRTDDRSVMIRVENR